MIGRRQRALVAVACALAAIALAGLVTATRAAVPNTTPGELARSLARAPAMDRSDQTQVAAGELRAVAASDAALLPLPDGGTFNGVRWELMTSGFPRVGVTGVLEYNAACQWLRAERDGRQASDARDVLTSIPSWPALRGTESAYILANAAAGGESTSGVLSDCDAIHLREVDYAKSRGLTPSS